jgi:hypothetical protein
MLSNSLEEAQTLGHRQIRAFGNELLFLSATDVKKEHNIRKTTLMPPPARLP